ncbi:MULTISPECIES: hypothetical protein [Sphingomonadales]|uniref:Uncharacterized protein n=1 Tax=Edaphosphingomonas haloaromaticamans TaxID=653954 RepID=A0A1S1HF03_9SPHN|nr:MULTISPECIES: hypothetical protein [Sphingomonas]MDX3883552.1 hypothetical protein [Sphingomonas sp.]OHT20839.1 hypothetical protein BHE75_02843 [Sphingomonas haloaromaticamans]
MRYEREYVRRRYREEIARAREAECPELRLAHSKLAEVFGEQLKIMNADHSFYATGLAIRRAAAR